MGAGRDKLPTVKTNFEGATSLSQHELVAIRETAAPQLDPWNQLGSEELAFEPADIQV